MFKRVMGDPSNEAAAKRKTEREMARKGFVIKEAIVEPISIKPGKPLVEVLTKVKIKVPKIKKLSKKVVKKGRKR